MHSVLKHIDHLHLPFVRMSLAELTEVLKRCPDLERLIARVHVGTCKMSLFLDLLDAFDKVSLIYSSFSIY